MASGSVRVRTCARLAPACLLALAIAGCDSESGAGGAGGTATLPPPEISYTSHTVTPSLGLVLNGTVRVLSLNGTVLASTVTGHSGLATLQIPTTATGPYLIELAGNEAASYYDEALDALVPLPAGTVVRALITDLADAGSAVTPLTEMAVQYLLAQHGSLAGLTAGDIAAANAFIRNQLAPELADITLPPTLVGGSGDIALLADASANDLYALKLAALARVGAANHALSLAPALDILKEMSADIADGALDGEVNGSAVTPATYHLATFASQLRQLAASYGGDAGGLAGLLDGITQYVSPQILALLVTPPGDDGPGDLLASWAGTYSGTYSDSIGGFTLVPGLGSSLQSAMDTILGTSTNLCSMTIRGSQVVAGQQVFGFASDLAAAATDATRQFQLGSTLASVSGFTAFLESLGLPLPQVNTTITTVGDVPASMTFTVSLPAPGSVSYSGTCTFN